MRNELRSFVTDNKKRAWTDDQIRALTPKQRNSLGKYSAFQGKSISSIDSELQALIDARGFFPGDGIAALKMMQEIPYNSMTQMESDSVVSKGGSQVTTLNDITLYTLSGEKVVRPNTPVPANPENSDRYSNLDVLAAFVGSLVSQSKGEWKIESPDRWVIMFPLLKIAGLNTVAQFTQKLLNTSPKWQAMRTIDKTSVTNINEAKFIRDTLNNLDVDAYNYLNTLICVEALCVVYYDKVDKDWNITLGVDDKPLVPAFVYESKVKTRADQEFSDDYPAVFIYKGGWAPPARVLKVTDWGSTANIAAVTQKVVQVAGGGGSMPSLLASSLGFSGMTTEASQKLLFIIGATLSCWAGSRVVDIRLTSDGDIGPLYAALSYWQSQKFGEFAKMPDKNVTPWFCFLTSRRNVGINSAAAIRETIRDKHRSEAVAICVLKDQLKTKANKDDPVVDHDANSLEVLPGDLPTDYIVKTPIYGAAFFHKDNDVIRSFIKTSTPFKVPEQYNNVRVYAHGSARNFLGVASTFPSCSLKGIEYEKTKKGPVPKLVDIPMKEFVTRESWYRNVNDSLLKVLAAMFNPKKTYSPLANLLVITKGKMNMLVSVTDDAESGFAQKVFVRQTKEKMKFMIGMAPVSTDSFRPVVDSTVQKEEPVNKKETNPEQQIVVPDQHEDEKGDSSSGDEDDDGAEDGTEDEEGESEEKKQEDDLVDQTMMSNLNDDGPDA